jgi:hypothetical protein
MDIEFVSYAEALSNDLVSGWIMANKAAATKLAKRCFIKKIIMKEALEPLIQEIEKWDGRRAI